MDRGIVRHFRDYRKLLTVVSAIGLWLLFSDQAYSQQRSRFQMPTPEDMFRQNDRDGNGRLDTDEINANPFLPRMLQRSGLDTSRSISERDFINTMEEARRNWEQNGGRSRESGDGDEGRQRYDRRRNEDDDDDDDEGRRRYGEENRDDDDDGESNGEDDDRPQRRSTERRPRPRVTLDLQEDLVAGDADRDGQIAFLEWRNWDGKTLNEFHDLDVNGDGYVTPREVESIRGTAEDNDETQVASADRRGPRGGDSESEEDSEEDSSDDTEQESGPDEDRDDPDTESSRRDGRDGDEEDSDADADRSDERRSYRRDERSDRSDGDDEDDRNARDRDSDESPDEARAAAERYFRLMDRNRDGELASDEWQGGRIRGMFEEDGIDLDDSMSEDDFIDNYVRLSSGD
jgi:hypothetical protein